ncbi:MAG: hypothetical protein M0Z66_15470 [Thermaerobacter sp.]|nr:hypothetical protein [Thermaerobacter sp.]
MTSNSQSGTGYLYAWTPGRKAAKVVATLQAAAIWSLAVDPGTGIVWIGAQHLYSYDPATGALQDYGVLGQTGESEVHAVAAYNGTVYAGLTPYTEVVQFEPQSGVVQVFQDMRSRTSGVQRIQVDSQSTVEILWESRALDIYVNGVQQNGYPHLSAAESTSVALGGQMYTFLPNGRIAQGWNESAAQAPLFDAYPTSFGSLDAIPVVAAGTIAGELVGVVDSGAVLAAEPNSTGWSYTWNAPNLQGAPGIIHAIYEDNNGSLWTSVYLGGQVTHVVGRTFNRYPFPAQADSFASYGGTLYIGAYPGAYLYAYDESQPWDIAAGNPKLIGRVQLPSDPQETRAFALAAGPAGIYLGTIPTDGYLPGELGYYNPASGTLQAFPAPVPDEGITSLVFASNGLLVGTTTALGGALVTPVHRSGRVFLWDPSTQALVATLTPQPGAPEWGGLVSTPYGVFGANRNAVFRLDPTTETMTVRTFDSTAKAGTWGSLTHMYFWRGHLYLLTGPGQMYAVDPQTLAATPIFWGAEQATVDGNYLYFSADNSVQLWDAPLGRIHP